MYEFFEGRLAGLAPQKAIVEAGGVGYLLQVSATTAAKCPAVGERVRLYAHLAVTDGEPRLFGFFAAEERELFRLLISVNGVGPSTAMALLSQLPAQDVAAALVAGDEKALRQVKGIGQKTATRLVIELKDTAGKLGFGAPSSPARRDAVSALLALGFTRLEAERLVDGVEKPAQTSSSEELVKLALAASRSR